MAEIVAKCPLCGEEIEYLIKREQFETVVYPDGGESPDELDPEDVFYVCEYCKDEVAQTKEQALAILNPEGPQPKGDGE